MHPARSLETLDPKPGPFSQPRSCPPLDLEASESPGPSLHLHLQRQRVLSALGLLMQYDELDSGAPPGPGWELVPGSEGHDRWGQRGVGCAVRVSHGVSE